MFQEESSDLPLPSSSCDPHSNKQDKRQQRLQQKEAARVLLSTITDPTVILFADWLRVRGTLRPWVRLWCVLKPGSLILYNSDKDKGSDWVGTLLLSACQVHEHCSKTDGSCFKLSSPTKQPVWATQGPKGEEYGTFVLPLPHSYCIFQAPSDSAGKCWIDALELAIKCTYLMKRSVVSTVDTEALTSNVAIPLQPPVPTATQQSAAAGGGTSRQGSPVPGLQWDSPRQENVHSRQSPDQQQHHSGVSAQLDARVSVFDKVKSGQCDHAMPLETPKVKAGRSPSRQHPGEEPLTPTRPPSPQSRSPPCKPLWRTHTAADRAVLLSGPLPTASTDPQEKEKFQIKNNHSRREWRSETVELKEPRSLSPVDSNHVRFSVSAPAKYGKLDVNQEESPPPLKAGDTSSTVQSSYRPQTASAPQKRAIPISTRSYVKAHALNDSESIYLKSARSDQLTEAKKQLKKVDRVTFGGDLERHQNEATQTSLHSEIEAGSSTFDSTSCEPDSSCTLLLFAPSHAPASSDTDVSRTRTDTKSLSHARTASEGTRSQSASWMFPENPTYDADASVTESTADYDSLKTNCSRDKTCVYKQDSITPSAIQSQSAGEETDKPSFQQSRSSSNTAGECGTWALNTLNTDKVDEETQTSCWRFEQMTPLSDSMAGRTDRPSRRSVRVQTNLEPQIIVGHSKLCQTGSLTTLHCHTKPHPRRGIESVSSGPQRTSDTDTQFRSPERRRRSGRNSRPSVTRQPADTETRSDCTARRCDICTRYMHGKTGCGKKIHFQSDDESSQKSKSETSVSTSPTETVDSSVDLDSSDSKQSDSQLSSIKPSESSADSESTSALHSTGFGSVPNTASSVASASDLSTTSQWGSSQDLSESATSDHDSDTDSISNTSRSLSQSSAINATSRRRGSPSYFTSKSGRRKTGRLYKKKPGKDKKKSKKPKGGDAGGSGQDTAGSESAEKEEAADAGGKESKKDKKGKKGDKKKKKGEGDEAASEEGGKKHKKHKKKSKGDTGEGKEVKEGHGEEPTSEEGGKKRKKSKSGKDGGKKRKKSKTKGKGGDEATSEEEDKKRKTSKTKGEGGEEATSAEGGKKGKKSKKRKKSKDTKGDEDDKKGKKSKSEDGKDTKEGEGGDEPASEEDDKKGKKRKKKKKSKSGDSKDTKDEGGDEATSEEGGKKGKKSKKRKKSKSKDGKDTTEGEGVSDEDGKKRGKGKKDKKKGKDKSKKKKKKGKKGAEAAEGGYVSDTENTAEESAVSEGGAAREGGKKHDEESLGTTAGESEVTDSEGGTGDAASHVSEKTDTEKEAAGATAEERKDTQGSKRGEEEAAPAEERGGGGSKTVAETAHKDPAEGEDDQKKVDEPAAKEVKKESVAERVKEKDETGRSRVPCTVQEHKEKERRESQTRPVTKISIMPEPAGQVTMAKEPAAAPAQTAVVASAAHADEQPVPSRHTSSPRASASGGCPVKDDGFVASDAEGSAAASRDMQMSDKTRTPKTSTASSAVYSDMKTSSPSGDREHVEGAPITGEIGDTGLDRPDNYQTSRQYQPEHGYPEASPLCPKCVNILRKQEAKGQPVDKTLNDRPMFVAQRYKLVKAGDPQYIFSSSAAKDESPASKEGRPSTPADERPSSPKSESPYATKYGSAPLPKDERPSTPKDERPSTPKDERPFTSEDEVQSPRMVSPQQLPVISQGATPGFQLQQYRPAGLSTKQPSLAELNYALLALKIRKVRAQNQKLELERASLRMDILVKEEHLNREYGRDKWRPYLRPDQLDMSVAVRPMPGSGHGFSGCQSPIPCSAGECNRSQNRGAPVMMLSLPEVTIRTTSSPWLVESSSDESGESECDCPDCAAMSGRRNPQRKRKRKSRVIKEYGETNVFMSVSANDLPLCCQNEEELVDNYHTRRHTDFTASAMREELMSQTEGRKIPSRYLKGCGLRRRVDYGGKQRDSQRGDVWKTGGSKRDRAKRRWSWKIRGIKLGQ